MPSVVGLLEQHELAARRRVDGLREEADRIQAELEWQEWAIARRRVDTVLTPDGGSTADAEVTPKPRDADAQSAPGEAAKPKSQVPVWRQGLAWSALSVDYQRILKALADRARLGQGPLTCQEMAAEFGMDVVPTRVEALRSKAKRLVARGWLAEPAPGRFALTQGVSGPGGGAPRHPPPRPGRRHRGSEYTSHECRKAIEELGLRQSMGRTGSC
ncbi:hypothetical protein ACFZB5_24120 [Streptomyces nodosus]|uniref:hypothetical protein n=1 Tax=Streptomyces nodosus TaxID=40318 RepID=UPI0036E7C754